jgi:hypothetical protein
MNWTILLLSLCFILAVSSNVIVASEATVGILTVYSKSKSQSQAYKGHFIDLNLQHRQAYCNLHGYLCVMLDYSSQLKEFSSHYSHLHRNCDLANKTGHWNKMAGVFNAMMAPTYAHVKTWFVVDTDAVFTDFNRPLEDVMEKNSITNTTTMAGCFEWYNPGAKAFDMPSPKCSHFYQPGRGRVSLNGGVLLFSSTLAARKLVLDFVCLNVSAISDRDDVVHRRVPLTHYYADDQSSMMLYLDRQPYCPATLLTQRAFNSHLHGNTMRTLKRRTCSQWRPGDYIAHGAGCGSDDKYCKPLIATLTKLALASRNGTLHVLFPEGSYDADRSMDVCQIPPLLASESLESGRVW